MLFRNAPKNSTTVGALATKIEEQDDSKLEREQMRLEACKQKIGNTLTKVNGVKPLGHQID